MNEGAISVDYDSGACEDGLPDWASRPLIAGCDWVKRPYLYLRADPELPACTPFFETRQANELVTSYSTYVQYIRRPDR